MAAVISITISVTAVSAFSSARTGYITRQHSFTANAYASELLEFFRSFKKERLTAYLQTNPLNGKTTVADLYKFCAHINIADRIGPDLGTILNGDPLADLPAEGQLPFGNRYYQIEIIDLVTGTLNKNACALTAADIAPTLNESYLVTVGVTWFEPDFATVKRVVLTTVIGASL